MVTEPLATDEVWPLVCVGVQQETHDVKTFTFRAQDGRPFGFEAGQHMRFDIEMPGGMQSRCYSLSSSPARPALASITVKRVPGGTVSNWLHDHLAPGHRLQAGAPAGQFTLKAWSEGPMLLVSGGVGITPLMSMLRALGDAHAHPDIVFLHAARSPADLVYQDELAWRAQVTPGLRVVLLPERIAGERGHTGLMGRLNADLLKAIVPDLAERRVWCCGPAPFMAAVQQMCQEQGLPPSRYQEERFGPSGEAPSDKARRQASPEGATHTIRFTRQPHAFPAHSGQTVLQAAREAGIRWPSSCGNGVCGTCKARLESGQVDMRHGGGIRQREVDAGWFLPCCSRALSDLTVDR